MRDRGTGQLRDRPRCRYAAGTRGNTRARGSTERKRTAFDSRLVPRGCVPRARHRYRFTAPRGTFSNPSSSAISLFLGGRPSPLSRVVNKWSTRGARWRVAVSDRAVSIGVKSLPSWRLRRVDLHAQRAARGGRLNLSKHGLKLQRPSART